MFCLDPQRYHDVYPEWVMPDAQWQAFANTRTGMIVGKQLADQFGWKIGQKIPIASNIWPLKNGSKAWTFDLVGIFDGKDEDWKKRTSLAFIQMNYFEEANQFGMKAGPISSSSSSRMAARRGRSARPSTRCSRIPRTRPRPRPRRTSTSAS